MGWQIPDMFQSITDKFLSTSFSLTGLELSETGACREHRGSVSCRCLLLWPLPLLLSVTESSAPQFNSARQASCKNHLRPPWTTWINMKGRSNRRVTSKYHLSSHVTTSSVPRPSNLYKTLLWKVPSEPFQNSAQHKKKWRTKCMYTHTCRAEHGLPYRSLSFPQSNHQHQDHHRVHEDAIAYYVPTNPIQSNLHHPQIIAVHNKKKSYIQLWIFIQSWSRSVPMYEWMLGEL